MPGGGAPVLAELVDRALDPGVVPQLISAEFVLPLTDPGVLRLSRVHAAGRSQLPQRPIGVRRDRRVRPIRELPDLVRGAGEHHRVLPHVRERDDGQLQTLGDLLSSQGIGIDVYECLDAGDTDGLLVLLGQTRCRRLDDGFGHAAPPTAGLCHRDPESGLAAFRDQVGRPGGKDSGLHDGLPEVFARIHDAKPPTATSEHGTGFSRTA